MASSRTTGLALLLLALLLSCAVMSGTARRLEEEAPKEDEHDGDEVFPPHLPVPELPPVPEHELPLFPEVHLPPKPELPPFPEVDLPPKPEIPAIVPEFHFPEPEAKP